LQLAHQHRVSAQGGVVLNQRDMADHTGQVNASSTPGCRRQSLRRVFASLNSGYVVRAVRHALVLELGFTRR
jgi:hypothetical protein